MSSYVFLRDSRLNSAMIFAPAPVTSDDAFFEENVKKFVRELYTENGQEIDDAFKRLDILQAAFQAIKLPLEIDESEYEKVIKKLSKAKRAETEEEKEASIYYGMMKANPNFIDQSIYSLEKILYCAKHDPGVKRRLKELGMELSKCGPGFGARLQHIIYELTVNPGFENWLPQLRYTSVKRVASSYVAELRSHHHLEPGVLEMLEIHVELFCHHYACQLDFNVPLAKGYASVREIYQSTINENFFEYTEEKFQKDFLKEYNYDRILEEVTARYANLFCEYENTNFEQDVEKLDLFKSTLEPFTRFNIVELYDVLDSDENGTRINKNFIENLEYFCEALLYQQGYFREHPILLYQNLVSNYMNKHVSSIVSFEKIQRHENYHKYVLSELRALHYTQIGRLSFKQKMELLFFFIGKTLENIRKSQNVFQRFFKNSLVIDLEAQWKQLAQKGLGKLSPEKLDEMLTLYQEMKHLKECCSSEHNNLKLMEKIIEGNEIDLAKLKRHKDNFHLIQTLHPIYLKPENLVKILTLSSQELTNGFVRTLNEDLSQENDGGEMAFLNGFFRMRSEMGKRTGYLLSPQDLLAFNGYRYLKKLVSSTELHYSWFMPKHRQRLGEVLDRLAEEKEAIDFLSTHKPETVAKGENCEDVNSGAAVSLPCQFFPGCNGETTQEKTKKNSVSSLMLMLHK